MQRPSFKKSNEMILTKLKPFIYLCLLTPAQGTNPASSSCSHSMYDQILTCSNLTQNLANLLEPNTNVIILKGAGILNFSTNYHANEKFEQITTYQISKCGAIELSERCFNGLKNLLYFKINDNKLHVIKNNVFYGLTELKTLHIVNCELKQIDDDAFLGLTNLRNLDLTSNTIKIISSKVFRDLPNLSSLSLHGNNIESLENGCFQGLTNLRDLDLTYNKIKTINTELFNDLESLAYLYLSFNEIENIEGDFRCKNLKFLYLRQNKLKKVSSTLFNSLLSLMDLDVSYNKIDFIAPDAFKNTPSLQHLNYRHNNLSEDVILNLSGSRPLVTS